MNRKKSNTSILEYKAFKAHGNLSAWLKKYHKIAPELWVRIYKKESGQPSVTWNDCVVAAIAWGWIDGHKKSLDDLSYLQRITPRRPKSNWSKKNREHAERLISEGLMQPAGLLHVNAAKEDGRWEAAYEGSAGMEIPKDFLVAVKKSKKAFTFFKTLDRKNLFYIYYQLTTAKKPETRARRMQKILDKLAREESFH